MQRPLAPTVEADMSMAGWGFWRGIILIPWPVPSTLRHFYLQETRRVGLTGSELSTVVIAWGCRCGRHDRARGTPAL